MEQVILRGSVPEYFGYGYGYGYGDGYGSKEYWSKTIPYFAAKWPEAQRLRLENLRASGATIAFWKSDKDGRACNGGKNARVTVGTVETAKGPLALCNSGTLHATLLPPKWKGERWWVVALIGEVVSDEDKFGALKREILGECE